MNKQSYQLLESLLIDAENLAYNDGNLDKTKKRAEMIVKKVFGPDTEYVKKLNIIRFSPSMTYSGMDRSIYNSTFQNGRKQLINLISVMLEDVSLSMPEEVSETTLEKQPNELSSNIFLVHGHNEEMKQATARFLEKIGLNPIILHEQPNRGRTIIEKFTDYANVGFAVILLSADDVAFDKTLKLKDGKLRARQNVILELGFFLGKIGRENVVVLHEQTENFEIPSDYQGVLYEPYDSKGNWKISIARELKASGYKIDGNKLLE
jgi:predicted nucleotide-binding protein